MTQRIKLDAIAFDAGTQIRAAIDQQVVSDYAEAMTSGATFPPIVLFHDGNKHYLADGFHRFMAAQRLSFREMDADVRAGTKEDAIWFALGANTTNGLRMSEADKTHAVKVALSHWPDRSATQIAHQIGCSVTYVLRLRSDEPGYKPELGRVTGSDGVSYPASREARVSARQRAEQLLREGKSVAEVRVEVGIGRDTAQQIRREIDGSLDKTKAGVLQRREQMREMAESGHTSRQIASALGVGEEVLRRTLRAEGIDVHADRAVGRIHKHDANRIVDRIVMDAENLTEGVNLIEFEDLDRERLAEWLGSLSASRDKLSSFIRRLMKEKEKHGEAA